MVAILAAAALLVGCSQNAGPTSSSTPTPSASATPLAGGPLSIRAKEGAIGLYAPKTKKPWRANFAVNVCIKDGASLPAVVEKVVYRKGAGRGEVLTRIRTATAADFRQGRHGFGSYIGPLENIPRKFGGKLTRLAGKTVANRCGAQEKDGSVEVITSVLVGAEGLSIEGFDLIYVSGGQQYQTSSAFVYVACGSRQPSCRR